MRHGGSENAGAPDEKNSVPYSFGPGTLAKAGERTPNGLLDMVIVMDRSGSMDGANWTGATSGLTGYFNDPSSVGTSVGLNLFPVDGALDQCDDTLYDPLQVALGTLPGAASILEAELAAQSPPGGGTPTYPALHGSLAFATAHKSANPARMVVVVLVSDGDPSECETSTTAIAALARSAYYYNGTLTYVVGLQGANMTNLQYIADAGGTTAYFLSDASLLGETLSLVREHALGPEIFADDFESADACTWTEVMPPVVCPDALY